MMKEKVMEMEVTETAISTLVVSFRWSYTKLIRRFVDENVEATYRKLCHFVDIKSPLQTMCK